MTSTQLHKYSSNEYEMHIKTPSIKLSGGLGCGSLKQN